MTPPGRSAEVETPIRTAIDNNALLAALDLGSNSFHMIVARHVLGQLRVIDRLRETVRLAEGLDGNGGLRQNVLDRSLECLSRFGQRIRNIPTQCVRVVATNSVRQLRDPRAFLRPAEAALGHPIEIISGREEARLVYLGVAHATPPSGKRRLVIDIGGGSTEFIIGEGYEPLERESLQMGCVASTRRFFETGRLSRKRWKEALTEVSAEFQQFVRAYRDRGWEDVIGSSGTIKSVSDILTEMKLARSMITDVGLAALCARLLEFERIEDIDLPGLSEERRPVIAGGLLVLQAAFNELGLKRMQASKSALREGVLYDMLGRASDRDPRDVSVDAMAERYGADREQSTQVERTALTLFDQAAAAWELDADARDMLGWAARVHEIGLAIAHSQHHVHGAYLIEHSDIAGFSRPEQQMLGALVRCQRRAISLSTIEALPERLLVPALRCTLLLRLAVLLHRGHDRDALPKLRFAVNDRELKLRLPERWLGNHPLTREDLDGECEELARIGYTLSIRTS
ncbi:MAG TPA: exopolyphosphatase [Xanthomonadaceae bacterium]|jgi:exopolyphosphatase/guanosine-5'-triphosphate,3'-diphosphate pyrophosphatase|nr:exopolyphosphatase [Xanthomonadaceae bacterium]